jgi:lysine biosynthesis protein LysW
MATCPECDAEIEVDEFDVDKGDLISCPDCGSNLEVINTSPIELDMSDDEEDEDEDEDEKSGDDEDDFGTTTTKKETKTTRKTTGTNSLSAKAAALDARLASLESVLVAYSGGVDSAFLGITASRVLGDRALCITADSPSYPDRHRELAIGTARSFHLRHELILTSEVERPEYRANPPTAATTASTSSTRTWRPSRARAASTPSPTAVMPTIAATIVPGARRRANSASSVRSTRSG